MCCERPSAKPPAPPAQRSKRIQPHRGIPNFLEMHYNYIGHTPGSREEKYKVISDVGVRIGVETYAQLFKRCEEAIITSHTHVRIRTDKIDASTTPTNWIKTGPEVGDDNGYIYQSYKIPTPPEGPKPRYESEVPENFQEELLVVYGVLSIMLSVITILVGVVT